jgi:hypothetical protein
VRGDFVVGDEDGVVIIPADKLDDVLPVAEEIQRSEGTILEAIGQGRFSKTTLSGMTKLDAVEAGGGEDLLHVLETLPRFTMTRHRTSSASFSGSLEPRAATLWWDLGADPSRRWRPTATAQAASSASAITGTMTPCVPAPRAFMIRNGSPESTRVMGVAPASSWPAARAPSSRSPRCRVAGPQPRSRGRRPRQAQRRTNLVSPTTARTSSGPGRFQQIEIRRERSSSPIVPYIETPRSPRVSWKPTLPWP